MKNLMRIVFVTLALGMVGCGRDSAGDRQHEADKSNDAASHAESLLLTDEQIVNAGIELAIAGPERIREQVPLYGTITANADRMRDVAARFPGVIRSATKNVGDAVRAGETLATVESNESLKTYPVTAPLAGVVTARNAYAGEQTGNRPLFTVADLSTVWAEIALFPRDANKVRVGQEIEIVGSDDAQRARGKVIYVAPVGTRANQTISARLLLDNEDGRWAPGLYVTANVTARETQAGVAVRSSAIQSLNGAPVVFVRTAEGFTPRAVRIGLRDSQWAEIFDGVRAGERYAAANSFVLKAELGKARAEHEH